MQSTKQMRPVLYENVVVTIKLSYVKFNLSKFISPTKRKTGARQKKKKKNAPSKVYCQTSEGAYQTANSAQKLKQFFSQFFKLAFNRGIYGNLYCDFIFKDFYLF